MAHGGHDTSFDALAANGYDEKNAFTDSPAIVDGAIGAVNLGGEAFFGAMKDTIRIGSRVQPTDPFWVSVRENMRRHAQDTGVTLVDINLPLETVTGEAQLSLLDDLLAQELDALISPRLPEALAQRLAGMGLPLIYTDETEYTCDGVVSPRGLGDAAAAAACFLLQQIHACGTIVMIGGEERHLPSTQRRVQGFLDAVAACPQVRCIQIPTLWRYEEAYEIILEDAEQWRRYIGRGPLAAVFGLSDSLALAGRDAFRLLGLADDSTQIVGINGDPLAIAAIIAGTMHATVETSAWDLACNVLDYGRQAACGEELPAHFPFGQRLVTIANAAQVAAEKLISIADVPSRLVDVNVRQEQQRLVQMQTGLELNRRVGSILDGPQLLHESAEIIRSRYEFDEVHVYWWRESDRCLTLDEGIGAQASSPAFRVPAGEDACAPTLCIPLAASGALGNALVRNQAVYIPDTLTSQRFAPDRTCPNCRSRVILPIRVGGKTLGVLDLHNHKRRPRAQITLDALQTLADQLGIAVRNAQLYAEALAAKADAERANLLKSRLLANVSHDLRTPLNIILGYSQAALSEPNPYGAPLSGELVQDLHHIQRSGQHLGRLIDDLLNLAQAEAGALEVYPQQIDAAAFLADVFAAVAGSNKDAAVQWRLQLPAGLPSLWADPVRLRQVLLNLLSNAARFTPHGHITLGASEAAGELHIWVEDTGDGLAAPEQERVFASFVSTEEFVAGLRARHGAGLGLHVAQHLVALHGGQLSVQSQAHGTIFHVRLPLRPAAPKAGAPVVVEWPQCSEDVLQLSLQRAGELSRSLAAYVAEHYTASLSRDEISNALRVSPNYLSRIFRRDTGLTPWQYLNQYRIVQAQKLLVSTTLSVTEVAERVGFNDPAYFVRVFHKETGKAPLQYRKSAK
jgi:signal transduction histidine kinase/AraC-like DNA-binding protein/ABC-type sugar transport system substrate-binding protein